MTSWHMMSKASLTAIDRRFLRILQEDGRITNAELAERVGLSPSPCLRRVRLLEEAGIIRRYVTLLDPDALGLGVAAFVEIRLGPKNTATAAAFETAIKKYTEIMEPSSPSGWGCRRRPACAASVFSRRPASSAAT